LKTSILSLLFFIVIQNSFAQTLQNEHARIKKDTRSAAEAQAQRDQDEENTNLAAQLLGLAYYCHEYDDLLVFYQGRVFEGKGKNLNQKLNGLTFPHGNDIQVKMYYKTKGDWITWVGFRGTIIELNTKSGDVYRKPVAVKNHTQHISERKAACSLLRPTSMVR